MMEMMKSDPSSYLIYVFFKVRYIQYPTPTIIAKIIRPIIMGARICIRNIMIATMTISAIIPTIIDPTLPAEPKNYYP